MKIKHSASAAIFQAHSVRGRGFARIMAAQMTT
jgi:hypothetical protein